MQNEIYTPMEQVLIKGALYAEALETKSKLINTIALDTLLLELEEQAGLMDGLPLEVEGVAL